MSAAKTTPEQKPRREAKVLPAGTPDMQIKQSAGSGQTIAAILLRGMVKAPFDIIDTLRFLKLTHKNRCVIYPKTPAIEGMLRKVKDYITWGEVSDATIEQLFSKRGQAWHGPLKDSKEHYSYTALEHKGKRYKPYFRLNPPRKGFGRKGIKVAFRAGGGLGYRREHMNDLIARMV